MGGVGKVRSKSSRLDATRDVNLMLQWKSLRWSNRHNACEKCGQIVCLVEGSSQDSRDHAWITGPVAIAGPNYSGHGADIGGDRICPFVRRALDCQRPD